MNGLDYKIALDALESSGRKILNEAKALIQSEKDDVLIALKEIAQFNAHLNTSTIPSPYSTSRYLTAKAIIARYEEIALLVLKDWSDDFLKDLGAGAAKAGKAFLGSLAGSFGVPVRLA